MPRFVTALVCLALLAPLPACGGGESDKPAAGGPAKVDGLPAGFPAHLREAAKDAMERAAARAEEVADAPVELTEELMEEYLKLHKELIAAVSKGEGSEAVFSRFNWASEKYQAVSAQFARAVQAGGGAMAVEAIETQIKQLEGTLSRMPEATRQQMTEAIEELKQKRDELLGEGADSELARNNAAMLRKYFSRFMEINSEQR